MWLASPWVSTRKSSNKQDHVSTTCRRDIQWDRAMWSTLYMHAKGLITVYALIKSSLDIQYEQTEACQFSHCLLLIYMWSTSASAHCTSWSASHLCILVTSHYIPMDLLSTLDLQWADDYGSDCQLNIDILIGQDPWMQSETHEGQGLLPFLTSVGSDSWGGYKLVPLLTNPLHFPVPRCSAWKTFLRIWSGQWGILTASGWRTQRV